MYNDRGVLGLGVLKGTMENLEGKPELLVAGFPVGLETDRRIRLVVQALFVQRLRIQKL